jgi:hypothetical protein
LRGSWKAREKLLQRIHLQLDRIAATAKTATLERIEGMLQLYQRSNERRG